MKNNLPMMFLLMAVVAVSVPAQAQESTLRKWYISSGGEMIFSAMDMSYQGTDVDPVVRFSGFFNVQTLGNFDFSDSFGVFTGLSIRNIGFIYDVPDSDVRKKARTYNLGIPVGFKAGNLDGFFLYGGYELEFPINYKEKTFIGGDKDDKFNNWFSSRTETVFHTLFVGLQMPYGANVKFKYYLTDFYNQGFTSRDENGNSIQPYSGIDVNMFYFALSFDLFRDIKHYTGDKGVSVTRR